MTWSHSDNQGHVTYVKIDGCDVDILDYAGATGSIGNIEASTEVESNAFLSNCATWLMENISILMTNCKKGAWVYDMRKLIKKQNENEERHKMHKFVMQHITCLKLLDRRRKQCNTLSCSPTSPCSFL